VGKGSGGAGDAKRKRTANLAPSFPPKKKGKVSSENRDNDDDDNDDDDDDRVDFVGVRQGELAAYKVAGPNPDIPLEEDGCKLKLTRNDRMEQKSQGSMITGITTTAYLNLLSRKCFHSGVRRTHDGFFRVLRTTLNEHVEHGTDGGFRKFAQNMSSVGSSVGDQHINWENDDLIFIQIFLGPAEAGHFALLVVDRTWHKPGILTYFDSLPAYSPDAFRTLQHLLRHSPLVRSGSRWLTANMPVQGARTNDCGIWMCMVATAYVNTLFEGGFLPRNPLIHVAREINEIDVVIDAQALPNDYRTSDGRARAVGRLGREHMLRSLRTSKWDSDEDLFQKVLKIHFR
jgi:hypothetical protein